MKAHELIEQDLTGKLVKLEIAADDKRATFFVNAQYAEWSIDSPEGPQVVLVREHENGAKVDLLIGDKMPEVDGARITRSEWVIPAQYDVELVDEPEVDCLNCDCEDECQKYGGPVNRSDGLDEEHVYTDSDGDELHAEGGEMPGPGVVVWTSATCVAVPQADLPTLVSGWMAQAGVSVVECYLDTDLDFGHEEKFFGSVAVSGGMTHPAEVSAELGLECILADMAFLAHIYQLKKSEQVDAVRVGAEDDDAPVDTDVVDEYLFAREKAMYALRNTYFDIDPDVLGPLTTSQREGWGRVLDKAAEVFGAVA